MMVFNLAAASNPMMRSMMVMANLYDKMHNGVEVGQGFYDTRPDEAAKYGVTKNKDGDWVNKDGSLVGGGRSTWEKPLFPNVDPEGWLKRQWDRLPSVPDGGGLTDGMALPGLTGDAGGTALQLLRDAIRPGASKGAVDINVTFDNAPPGMTFTTTSSGTAAEPTVDVGRAFHDGGVPVPNGL